MAADYSWGNGSGNGGSPDPGSACTIGGQTQYAGSSIQLFDHAEVVGVDGTTAFCQYYFTYTAASGVDDTTLVRAGVRDSVYRIGSQCPANTGPYVPTTGVCTAATPQLKVGDKCADQTGGSPSDPMIWDGTGCVHFTTSEGDAPCAYIAGLGNSTPQAYSVVGNIDATGNAVAPPEFAGSALKCAVGTISTSDCTVNVAGAVSCNVIGKILDHANPSGTQNAADALCTDSKPCAPKDPVVETKTEACTPVGTGSGGTTCTETKQTTADGEQQCGTVNGAYKCVTKQPASNGLTTNISATSQTLGDGSVKVTTVKDSTLTVCTDVKTCTTKTSTTTTHSTTSPSGTTKTDTSCKGTCNTSGGGVETTPNAGTGTGDSGTCTGDKCGDGGAGTAATTEDCATPPPCNGDPFQCAILQQAHIDTCKLMAMPDDKTNTEWNAKIAKSQADQVAAQTAMDTQVNSLLGGFQSATGGGGTGGGKCLPDVPFDVMGHTMNMEFSKTCDAISFVRLIILAIAYLAAAKIVYKEV
jgi:hypothetical protein